MDGGSKVGLVVLFAGILVGGAALERELGRDQHKRTDRSPRVSLLLEPLAPAALPILPPGEAGARAAAAHRTYVVQQGDTLGKIAQKTLGTTAGWRALLALNQDVLERPEQLRTGMTLKVPGPSWRTWEAAREGARPPVAHRAAAPSTGASAAGARPAAGGYVVQPGDTLGAIAQRVLGSAREADRLFEANRDLLASPNALQVGMRLRVPPPLASGVAGAR